MNIALIGYGKMGQTIEQIAVSRGHTIGLKISIENPEDFTQENMDGIDVAIEFSAPEVAFHHISKAIDMGTTLVSGTTGWLDHYPIIEEKIKQAGIVGFIYASNFSLGVNLFFELNRQLARLMNKYNQYEVSLEEIHHTAKLDAPSGTAITLAEGILDEYESKSGWTSNAMVKDNSKVNITSKRENPAPGTHIINYDSDIDSIQISHTAHSREGFALGAVLAAEWLAGKKGIFTMKDVLGL
jgi:4-hydroxy-tetrahydrodipicolinate reductase